jgi:hypothetical protein
MGDPKIDPALLPYSDLSQPAELLDVISEFTNLVLALNAHTRHAGWRVDEVQKIPAVVAAQLRCGLALNSWMHGEGQELLKMGLEASAVVTAEVLERTGLLKFATEQTGDGG